MKQVPLKSNESEKLTFDSLLSLSCQLNTNYRAFKNKTNVYIETTKNSFPWLSGLSFLFKKKVIIYAIIGKIYTIIFLKVVNLYNYVLERIKLELCLCWESKLNWGPLKRLVQKLVFIVFRLDVEHFLVSNLK